MRCASAACILGGALASAPAVCRAETEPGAPPPPSPRVRYGGGGITQIGFVSFQGGWTDFTFGMGANFRMGVQQLHWLAYYLEVQGLLDGYPSHDGFLAMAQAAPLIEFGRFGRGFVAVGPVVGAWGYSQLFGNRSNFHAGGLLRLGLQPRTWDTRSLTVTLDVSPVATRAERVWDDKDYDVVATFVTLGVGADRR